MEFLTYMVSLPSLGIGLLVAVLNVVRIIAVHNKNNRVLSANEYVDENDYEVISQDSKYVRTYETKVKISSDKK